MNHHVQVAHPGDFLGVAALDRIAWGEDSFIVDGEHVWRVWCEYATVLVIRAPGEATQGQAAATQAESPDPSAGSDIAAALVVFPTHEEVWFLHKIMVDPRWRGRGMGTALMEAALARLAAPVLLTVDPVNEAAIELYRRYGFVIHRHIEGYYRPHEHRYLMIRHPTP